MRTRLNCKFNIDRQVREKYCPLRLMMIHQGTGRFRYNKPWTIIDAVCVCRVLQTYTTWEIGVRQKYRIHIIML